MLEKEKNIIYSESQYPQTKNCWKREKGANNFKFSLVDK